MLKCVRRISPPPLLKPLPQTCGVEVWSLIQRSDLSSAQLRFCYRLLNMVQNHSCFKPIPVMILHRDVIIEKRSSAEPRKSWCDSKFLLLHQFLSGYFLALQPYMDFHITVSSALLPATLLTGVYSSVVWWLDINLNVLIIIIIFIVIRTCIEHICSHTDPAWSQNISIVN